MARTPEGKVKDAVKKVLDKMGVYHFSPYMAGYGRSGVPDIVCCVRGKFVAIECKAGTNPPTALQEKEMGKIKQCGGVALVVNEGAVRGLEEFLTDAW